jgi:hypothetical protein
LGDALRALLVEVVEGGFGMLRERYGEPNARRIQSRDRRFPENDKTSETGDARTFKVILSYYADLEKSFATKKNSKLGETSQKNSMP